MKILSKKIPLLVIAIASACLGSSVISAEETYDNQERKFSIYNPDAQEQSVLFTFLQKRLFLYTAASLLEENDACDYCELRDNLSLKYTKGMPEFLKELGFSQYDSSDSNKNCNLCKLLNKLPYEELYTEMLSKLTELQKAEYYLLTEQVGKFTEDVELLFDGFEMSSIDELKELNGFYKQVYDRLEKNGNFPNFLDKISILKAVTDDVLELLEEIEKQEDLGELSLNLAFAKALAEYKEFLADQMDIIVDMQTIASMGFQIENPNKKCTTEECEMRKIETLSEIMTQIEKWQKSPKLSEEEIGLKLKDLL